MPAVSTQESLKPLVVVNVVGLTQELLQHAPNLRALAESGQCKPLSGVFPAVTMTAQASLLSGLQPSEHGVVGNSWYRRDLGEVRNWIQTDKQISGEPFYRAARRMAQARGQNFTHANLFWWFNEGSDADWRLTPKPHYGSDGSKAVDIFAVPHTLKQEVEERFGAFPFFSFWGPKAGLPSSEWISRVSAWVIEEKQPSLTTIYLPHLDYDLQRFGESRAELARLVGEVDACCARIIAAASAIDAQVMVVSEYGLNDVSSAALPNLALREAGLLKVRDTRFGELIDTFESDAFCVCDHQIAHVYVNQPESLEWAREVLSTISGVERVLNRSEQEALSINHEHAGELVLVAERKSWFAYNYWLDAKRAPDFARSVDIHRKPGYDPCELFVDPKIRFPMFKVIRTLIRKLLGFRYRMQLTPLDPSIVKGSHGRLSDQPEEGPLLVASKGVDAQRAESLCDVKALVLDALGLGDSNDRA